MPYIKGQKGMPGCKANNYQPIKRCKAMVLKACSLKGYFLFASMTVFALSLLVKVLTSTKEIFIARQFGVGEHIDAFVLAFLLPGFILNVFSAALTGAFIPVYVRVREQEGGDSAQQLLSGVLARVALYLLLIVFILCLSAPIFIHFLMLNQPAQKSILILRLSYLLMPAVLISGLASLGESVLNAGEKFAAAALAPMMQPISIICAVWLGAKLLGVFSIATGMLCGYCLELWVVLCCLRRTGVYLIPRLKNGHPLLRQVMLQVIPLMFGSMIVCSSEIVDQSMAASLGAGSVAALSYGNKLNAVCTGLISLALGTVALPRFSKMAASEQWIQIKINFSLYVKYIALLSLPITISLIYFSRPLVRLLFEGGAFTQGDALLVAHIQSYLLLQFPFFTIGILGVQLLIAMGEAKLVMCTGIANFFINIIGNYVLMHVMGVTGIALATSFVYFCSMILILAAIKVRLQQRITSNGLLSEGIAVRQALPLSNKNL